MTFSRVALTLLLGSVCAVPANAKEGDTVRPFLSYARYFDSNLFRLDEGETSAVIEDGVPRLITRETASDQYSVLSAGLNIDWQPGRQRVLASATKNFVRFNRYSSLDYDGSDYRLQWNWRVGNHWSGQVGANQTVTQTSFTDWTAFQAVNNQITRENRFASADWQFHPRWSIGGGAATATATNSTVQQAPLDYNDTSVYATLGYTTPKGSKLRGQLRRVEGEYPNRMNTTVVDRAYTQTEYNLLGDWNVSGKLTTRGKLGYVQRKNDTVSQRDFSGVAGRLTADYLPTGKAALNWAIYREVGNSDSINASYQVNTGTTLGAAWLVQPKVTLRSEASYENRKFDGNTGFGGGVRRDEDTLSGALSLSYRPIPMASLDLGVQAGRRESNAILGDYSFRTFFFNVRADF